MDGYTGAGGAAMRIHLGLLARGIDSRFCVAYPTIDLENSFTPKVTPFGRIARKVRRHMDDALVRHAANQFEYLASSGACGFNIARIVGQVRPDIVQLHLIGFHAFRLATLARVRAPVVWRCPDQWAFCGLSHYEPDPARYSAPLPNALNPLRPWTDLSEHVRLKKGRVYRKLDPLVVVCPSHWLAEETRRSALLRNRRIEVIPTACDATTFTPKDRKICRAALGLPGNGRIILVGAGSLDLKSKGLDLFCAAMQAVHGNVPAGGRNVRVVTFGKQPFRSGEVAGGVHHMGHVTDRRLLSLVYSAADVFVAPSRMENLANTVLESLGCGTPVVAYDIGGMPDAIDHKVNGYLATPFSTQSLADGINWILQQQDAGLLRAACRDKVLKSFSRDEEINNYIALYESILRSRPAGSKEVGAVSPPAGGRLNAGFHAR